MKIHPINLADHRMVRGFQRLPFSIYKAMPQWVPPLSSDADAMLERHRNPFFRHSEAIFLMALDENNQPLGRLAVLDHRRYNEYNHERTAFFFLFECVNRLEVAQGLFNAGCAWAQERGLEKIIGPKGFTALDGLGLLVKGFEHRPALGIPYNPDYYINLIEECGFEQSGEMVSGYMGGDLKFPEKIHEVSRKVQERRGLHILRFNKRSDLKKFVPYLKGLYNGALEGTTGNVPLTDEEARKMADQILWFADPRLIKIIMKGEDLVGFLFAYPDISAAIQRTRGRLFPFGWLDLLLELRRTKWVNINGAGILDEYRGLGGTAILFSELHKSVVEGGFEHVELVQIGRDNERMQLELRNLGIDFYKTHRMYQKAL
jgi:hypothetical protein